MRLQPLSKTYADYCREGKINMARAEAKYGVGIRPDGTPIKRDPLFIENNAPEPVETPEPQKAPKVLPEPERELETAIFLAPEQLAMIVV